MQLFDECRDGLILSKLINDTISGAIEIRSPEFDLTELISGGLEALGWRISLTVESSWRVDLGVRLEAAWLAGMLPQVRSR